MKSTKIFAVIILLLVNANLLFAQGINFENLSFQQAKNKAKTEKKLIFIDVYTEWCGPCKMMSSEIFTDAQVGKYFNSSFINLKIDAEKGEGIEVAKEYQVNAFPTMLIMDSEGKVYKTLVGSRSVQRLLDDTKDVPILLKYGGIDKMKEQFLAGKNDTEFLLDLNNQLTARDPLKEKIAVQYLLSADKQDLVSEDEDLLKLNNSMINQLSQFYPNVYNRLLGFISEKYKETGKFSNAYSMMVIFSIEASMGKIIERNIQSNNLNGLNEAIQYKNSFKAATNGKLDGDLNISSGRNLFFASDKFIKYKFLQVHDVERKDFRNKIIPYIDSLTQVVSMDSLKRRNVITESMAERMQKNHLLAENVLTRYTRKNDLTVEQLFNWTRYFWKISDNSKETKNKVGQWLSYAYQLNPLNANLVRRSIPILIKTDNKEIAIQMLKDCITFYNYSNTFNKAQISDFNILLEEINLNKI